ncbi:DEAD/DEAH box helicase [Actinocorallia libanotica]|uniref:DEAD/DEAH box helicase n=1 Tax=Actinocorallia libanotica TaxID=46162 RepID=A0ABN1RSR8_9ACTN
MKPTLAAEELRKSLTEYLSTTFALVEPPVRGALERFLLHDEQGIFRGPYLRIRTPFRPAEAGWDGCLQWAPDGWKPYRHQGEALRRLSSLGKAPEPTLITTGTGSGKTESFLVPVLDHCRREKASGRRGVKAVLLYPMNALATDQAGRINAYLEQEPLRNVTAALYIGDAPATGYARVMTQRSEIRRNPPDILITNYKMLDLLLQRGDDLPLWKDADLRYIVIDEFHTYDGAQGTDVAMLLRRLASATGGSRPGSPMGGICPVATSATLGEGSGESGGSIREIAEQVFGVPFPEDSVIGEDRLSPEEFVDLDDTLPLPSPHELMDCGDPLKDPAALDALAEKITGRSGLTPSGLGGLLKRHILTQAVLELLSGGPKTPDELLELLPRRGAYGWGSVVKQSPKKASAALARFIALISHARDPENPDRPFLLVETHVWVRAVSRLLRLAHRTPAFAWVGELPVLGSDSTLNVVGRNLLPAVYCRHCGRSGWAAYSPDRNPAELVTQPERIYRASVSEKKRVRPLILATKTEFTENARNLVALEGDRLRPVDPARDEYGEGDVVFVLADTNNDDAGNNAAKADRCPACDMDQGIRFLGAGLASLASVAITQLFAGDQLEDGQRKTLMFNDSVQDAAHRAGFVASRSYQFSLRRLLASRLESAEATRLNELIADVVAAASDPAVLPAVVPPDLHEIEEIDAILAGTTTGGPRAWKLIGERLAFAIVMELGLRSRQGRTLELTRTASAEVVLPDPEKLTALARDEHQRVPGLVELASEERYLAFLRGLLERLRTRGAIKHRWLDPWLANAGTNRYKAIWGKRPEGMPAFPKGLGAPTFLLDRAKNRSEFDRIDSSQSWAQDWTTRCLGLPRGTAGGYLARMLSHLASEGVVSTRTASDGATRVYGLQPGHIQVRLLEPDEAERAGAGCDACAWTQTVHPSLVHEWIGQPCPRYRCSGHLTPRTGRSYRNDFYRRLYTEREDVFSVVTAEHTGALTRKQRETVEERFREGDRYSDPNVMSCTPTLELGIDIGELSAVVLASLPPGPANYVQRVGRAGRRTGNAFLVTMVGRSPRDLYFLDEPRDMIAGEIVPPGSYLSAVEILRRQYAAHLIDRAARGLLGDAPPLPRVASALFGGTGWLAVFTTAALADADALVTGFLDLFGTHVSASAAAELRGFAASGLKEKIEKIQQDWDGRLAELRERRRRIEEAVEDLIESDPGQRAAKKSLEVESGAVARRIGEIGRQNAQNALVELGLLPNYSLLDTTTALEATLTWEEADPKDENRPLYRSDIREYQRPASVALTELAPGNSFYMLGYEHQITGLDVGTDARQTEKWRICPSCGYVRTHLAETDASPCPRCADPAIGGVQHLHRVLKPARVTSHDRRDDAKIRDDRDDRRRMYYEGAVAVDIDPADFAPGSWRHSRHTFGVDFARRAVVRTFNLGPAKQDRPAADRFAGSDVRLNPFRTCPVCGGTALESGLAAAQTALAQTSSIDKSRQHHRGWCRHRRSADDVEHLELILAHELPTEALRILLPVATLMIEERTVSFQAALMAGIAAGYGGDPSHLRVVTATMPDGETGRRRRFLVLHDALPGGTGYLHRLADPEEFRGVLFAAYKLMHDCPCAADPNKRACHRCLLSHVPAPLYDRADRAEALGMFEELLEGWTTEEVSTTHAISLWDLIESELEARFLGGLEAWARRPDTPGTLARGDVIAGRRTADLRIEADDSIVHWQVTLQNTIRKTRPDVLFRRLDGPPLEVAVYLDGYSYHASPAVNRLAYDAHKRMQLRAHGRVVYQLTWDDLEDWEKRGHAPDVSGDPKRPPYGNTAQMAARKAYKGRAPGREPDELVRTVWTNPVDSLLAFLREPDPELWLHRAEAAVNGLAQIGDKVICSAGAGGIAMAALRGEPLPPPGQGRTVVARTHDAYGCPLVVVVDQRSDISFSAFALIDDRAETVAADEPSHKQRWAAWLYWGNLLQFLGHGSGDGVQLALTRLDEFDPSFLVVEGGAGVRTSLGLVPLDADLLDGQAPASVPPSPSIPAPVPAPRTPPVPPEGGVDSGWTEVFDLLDPDEPFLADFAQRLAALGVPAPAHEEVGYELGEQAWQAEIAWPAVKIAIVLAGDGDEEKKRNAAYEAAGWSVREVQGWTAEELADRIKGA